MQRLIHKHECRSTWRTEKDTAGIFHSHWMISVPEVVNIKPKSISGVFLQAHD